VIVLPELIPEKGFRIMGEEKKKNKDRGGEGLLSRRRHLTKFIKDLESEQGYNPELIKKYKQQLEEVEKELDIEAEKRFKAGFKEYSEKDVNRLLKKWERK
jgi:hypothetical protein